MLRFRTEYIRWIINPLIECRFMELVAGLREKIKFELIYNILYIMNIFIYNELLYNCLIFGSIFRIQKDRLKNFY